jgi:hypothetical protein
MGAVKEMWFAEMERLTGEYIDQGMDPQDAYEKACERAQESLVDHWADLADNLRKRAKGE